MRKIANFLRYWLNCDPEGFPRYITRMGDWMENTAQFRFMPLPWLWRGVAIVFVMLITFIPHIFLALFLMIYFAITNEIDSP